MNLMNFLISPAYAETAPPAGGDFSLLVMVVIFGLVFYFMIWRPQAKRAKEHKNLMASLDKGNEVLTNGGLVGKISKVTDDFIVITVAEGVDVNVQKAAVVSVLPKGTLKSI